MILRDLPTRLAITPVPSRVHIPLFPSPMLQLNNISKAYAGRVLFDQASLQLMRGDRLGLVGPNGAGKSTLFNIILGKKPPTPARSCSNAASLSAYLPQESAPVGDETVLEMATAHMADALGWEAEPKAKRILRGLAFRESDFNRPAKALSGGWVMRAHLARLLVQEPDSAPARRADQPPRPRIARLVPGISQDLPRRHPDDFPRPGIPQHAHRQVVEIAHERLNFYTGNYESYCREKVAREEQHLAAYKNQQQEIENLQDFADRFRAKASKAAQAQSKLKQIDAMEKIDAPLAAAKTVTFRFPQPPRSGIRAITLEGRRFCLSGTENLRRPQLRSRARPAHRPRRPERRRQIHAAENPRRRPRPPERRAHPRPQRPRRLLRAAPSGNAQA